jgi:HK97 gp10 family phage protein
LEQNLKMLDEQVRERGTKRMMSRASVPMRDDAKRRVPVLKEPDPRRKPGTVRDALKIWRQRNTPYAATYYVGVRGISGSKVAKFKKATGKASTDNPNDPFYWRFLELGTPKTPALGFLRKAFESRKGESVRVALEEGRKFIQQVARKLRRLKRTT